MYLKRLLYKNVGPISRIDLNAQFEENGNPKPIILVGKNGSGKSILLSNIVDAFYEMAHYPYNNAMLDGEHGAKLYYKTINPDQITIGQDYMIAYAQFVQDEHMIDYIFKSGKIAFDKYCLENGLQLESSYRWEDLTNVKKCVVAEEIVKKVFESDIVVNFTPMRYERPYWKGNAYHSEVLKNVAERHYNGVLRNTITANIDSRETLQWLYDVITDSRPDIDKHVEGGYKIVHPNTGVLELLNVSRTNVEKLMSTILGEKVVFRMSNRSFAGRRFAVCRLDGNAIVNSLDALSTGQLALFEMFSTIIRYADTDNIDLSHRLNEISGIVVIDEVELHLHSSLQREILPKLLKLFPKVQFIITSHSPLFLLGMQEAYGDDGISIIEMPSGTQISAEQFSEFENAYSYYTETECYQKDIRSKIDKNTSNKALIVTEGATDWKHFKAAYQMLTLDTINYGWLSKLDFEFLEYEPANVETKAGLKLQMSGSELKTMCQNYSYTPHNKKIIFIADNDEVKTKKELGPNNDYVTWGNNVYSFCLPVPAFRTTEAICVEHLYRDEDIKKEVEIEGLKRRVFLGNEFNENGFMENQDGSFLCCYDKNACGPTKISIIDGGSKKKVVKVPCDDNVNFALSKMDFANFVLEKKVPFDHMDFTSFVPVFDMIRKILSVNSDTKSDKMTEN